MNFFQIVVTGIFISLVMVGVGVFAVFGGFGSGDDVGRVELWGTLDQSSMQGVLTTLSERDKTYQNVIYTALPPEDFQERLVDAIASGQGPDLFFITQDSLGALSDKLSIIPYDLMSQKEFASAFIDEAQLFVTPQGYLALPFSVDPLLMYWNRDLFSSASVAQPPQYWNDFLSLAPKMSSLSSNQVRRSAVALGGWDNVRHAKAVLSALFMQAGDFVTARSKDTGRLVPIFGDKTGGAAPAEEALRFYTDFANPGKVVYSWNRSLPDSLDAFISNDLAIYLGFASDYKQITERNPNLRFSIAVLPQLENTPIRITYGSITGLAVARGAQNPRGAFAIAQKLSTPEASAAVLMTSGLAPVRRDALPETSGSAALETVIESALISNAWADPNRPATDDVFKTMVESVLSGRQAPDQAVYEAASVFRQLLPNQ